MCEQTKNLKLYKNYIEIEYAATAQIHKYTHKHSEKTPQKTFNITSECALIRDAKSHKTRKVTKQTKVSKVWQKKFTQNRNLPIEVKNTPHKYTKTRRHVSSSHIIAISNTNPSIPMEGEKLMLQKKIADIRAKRARGEKGFTLVELLVVVVILVALAAIAVPIFLNQANKAKQGAAQSNVSAIANVIKNGQALGATVAYTAATDTVGYVDADTGEQSILAGDAQIHAAAAAALAANANLTSAWCVQQTGGGVTYTMDAGDTVPVVGTCPTS